MKKNYKFILIIILFLLTSMLIPADEYSNAMNGVNAIKQGNSLYDRGCDYYDSAVRWNFPGTDDPDDWNDYIREINQKLKSLDKSKKYFYDAREKYNYASQVFGGLTILKSSRNIRVYHNNLNLARRNSNNTASMINKTENTKSKLKNLRSEYRGYIAKSKEKDAPDALSEKIFHKTNYNGQLHKYTRTVAVNNNRSYKIKAEVFMWAGYYKGCVASSSNFVKLRKYKKTVYVEPGESRNIPISTEYMVGKVGNDKCTGISKPGWRIIN